MNGPQNIEELAFCWVASRLALELLEATREVALSRRFLEIGISDVRKDALLEWMSSVGWSTIAIPLLKDDSAWRIIIDAIERDVIKL